MIQTSSRLFYNPTMLNDTTASIHPMVKIKDQWARPLVDASRGNLYSMMGRMNRQNEADNEVYRPNHNLNVIY